MHIAHVPVLATPGAPKSLATQAPAVPAAPSLGFPVPPAAEYYNRHGADYLRIPGVNSIGWGTSTTPGVFDTFHVNVVDHRAAAVLVGLLEPEVAGIKVSIRVGGEPYQGTHDASFRDRVAAVAAMTGVWDYKYLVGPNGGRVTFSVVTQDFIDRLDPLLQTNIPLGTGQSGKPAALRIYWKAGVPAK